MSTTSLVILAIFVAIAAFIALWLAQYRQQKAIERARQAVLFTDAMRELHQGITDTLLIIDPALTEFAAQRILTLGSRLKKLNTSISKQAQQAMQQASEWLESPSKAKEQAKLAEPKKARAALRALIHHIKIAAHRKDIAVPAANKLIKSIKLCNLKISCDLYLAKANAAIKLNNPRGALTHYRKLKGLLQQQKELPEHLMQIAKELDNFIEEQQAAIRSQSDNGSNKRLEAEFDKLEEDDQFSTKKTAL